MPELIDKAKVLKYLTPRIKTETPYGEGYNMALEDAAELVTLMPTIEPEVRLGRWIPLNGWMNKGIVKCSICGNTLNLDGVNAGRGDANFCPHCGARMDGGADNAESD